MNALAAKLVEAVADVRSELGVGLVESVYVECLAAELRARSIPFELEVSIPIIYKGDRLGKVFRIDMLVAGDIVVETKAVESLHTAHFAQLLTYLRLSGKPLGFLVNFNAVPLATGIHRRVNTRGVS